ncbi:MAG: hypothetical protein V7735_21395 [Photobacterium frigidiphilum]|uniref:hypothetical protein n=1 Tax=Photobacterium frigidiphilum TaxID=264736 RepID=UPI00300310ED
MSKHRITDGDIHRAKANISRRASGSYLSWCDDLPHHEHNDCVRIAYEWLDAQKRTVKPVKDYTTLKHCVELWGGRYVSTTDVILAAFMLGLEGDYPCFNLSKRKRVPAFSRLIGIAEANKHRDTAECKSLIVRECWRGKQELTTPYKSWEDYGDSPFNK